MKRYPQAHLLLEKCRLKHSITLNSTYYQKLDSWKMPSVGEDMGFCDSLCTVQGETGAAFLEADLTILCQMKVPYPLAQHCCSWVQIPQKNSYTGPQRTTLGTHHSTLWWWGAVDNQVSTMGNGYIKCGRRTLWNMMKLGVCAETWTGDFKKGWFPY